ASGEGSYSFSQVVPATYTVVAEAPGFKRFERKHVIVATQETVSLDLKMEIGSVSESVQVTEEVPLIDTSNASQGQVLDLFGHLYAFTDRANLHLEIERDRL